MCLFTALEQCGAGSGLDPAVARSVSVRVCVDINRLGCKVSVSLVNLRVEVYESFIASWTRQEQ